MSEYKELHIDTTENGFVITTSNGKRFVFSDSKQMREWIMENLSATGEVERFSDALDDKKDTAYNNIIASANYITSQYTKESNVSKYLL